MPPDILDAANRDQLSAVAALFGDAAHAAAGELHSRCAALSVAARQQYDAPVVIARGLIDSLHVSRQGGRRQAAAKAIIAAAALKLPQNVADLQLPEAVSELMPAAVGRLTLTLLDGQESGYDESSDIFRKDIRFVACQSVPCGAQDVDLYSASPWTTLLKNPSPSKIARYLAAGGRGVWFRIHTDPRNTAEFDESGWRRCYLRIADLLKSRPEVRGMVGTSWFYDPQLLKISPRLAYLQTDPLAGGAFMLRNGPGEIHTQRATATSPSRRKLYEEGKYLPVCWSLLWPRAQLLAWASAQRRANG